MSKPSSSPSAIGHRSSGAATLACYDRALRMASTLLRKVWDAHTVRRLPNGQTQLFVGLHLIHEVTTPQAFDMLHARGLRVAMPERTIGTVDHIVPTLDQRRPFLDVMAEEMLTALEKNCRAQGIRLLNIDSGQQG